MKNRIIIYGIAAVVFLAAYGAYIFSITSSPSLEDQLNYIDDNKPQAPEIDSVQEDPEDKREPIVGVQWITPKLIAKQDFFASRSTDGELYENTNENAEFYLVGTVTEGKHAGKDVIRVDRVYAYPGDEGYNYALATKASNGTYASFELLVYSTEYWDEYVSFNTKTVTPIVAKLQELELPKKITSSAGEFEYVDTIGVWVDNPLVKPALEQSSAGTLYLAWNGDAVPLEESASRAGKGGFYLKTKDHRVAVYRPLMLNAVAVNLIDGEKYRYVDFGGCGASNVVSIVAFPETDFEEIGKAKYDGAPLYALKDKNHEIYKHLYNFAYFEGEYDFENKIPYGEFVKRNPVVFWRDNYNRMVKFISEKVMSMAECGKPVIYLYPETTSDIRVEVAPEGGFSKTIPEYNGGWNVIATPESVITNKADGQDYPYLFWEGRGGLYVAPEQGFVMKQEEVEAFLDDALSQYGLIEKEITDFKEFWLPRMQVYPYYFVSFYDNKVMDKLAPLTITPKPDSVIRVLMDYKGLDAPIEVQEYKIPQRERKGFTVIEWGGVIQ